MALRPLTIVVSLIAIASLSVPTGATAGGGSTDFEVGIQSDNVLLYGPDPLGALDETAKTGASPLRISIHWSGIAAACKGQSPEQLEDPNNSCYVWDLVDTAVKGAHARDMRVLASISQVPVWMFNIEDSSYVGTTKHQFEYFARHYTAFVHAVAVRYGPKSNVGTIDRWTIWNEPNSETFWNPQTPDSPRRYASLYALSAPEIKDVNPLAQVAIGPTGPKSTTKPLMFVKKVQPFLLRYLKDRGGATKYIDAWAHNPYPGALLPPDFQVFAPPSVGIGNLEDLFKALDSSPATRGLPIWATEYSYQTNPPDTDFGVSWSAQANWLADGAYLLWRTHRASIMIWYVLEDPAGPTDWQSGLVTTDGEQKPAYRMFRRMIALSKEVAGPGDSVDVWGRSSDPNARPHLVWRWAHRSWRRVPGQRENDDGTLSARITARRDVEFAVREGGKLSPARSLAVGSWDDVLAGAGHVFGVCSRCRLAKQ